VIWTFAPDFSAAVTKLFGGDADVFTPLRLENLRELGRHRNLRSIMIPGTEYAFLQFNLRDATDNSRPHPLFGSGPLRRAVAMSIDRNALVRSVFDTLATVPLGPTVRAFNSTDPSIPQIQFDSARSRVLLDSLGWATRNSDGIRTRSGRPLTFSIIVPTNSISRMRMAVLIQEQLRRAGIGVTIEQMDGAAHSARLRAHSFDAALNVFRLGSSLDGTKQGWTSAGQGANGLNYGSYSNPVFDAQLDTALRSEQSQAKVAFTRAYATINGDVPAVWLYEPKTVIGVHARVRTPRMRPDAWWIGLADWYIPQSERILRDRLPAVR
jgi:peptide/nickel transport system substrate-binding protein